MFILGMFSKRANAKGAIMGWIAGIVVVMTVCFDTEVSFLWYTLTGFLVTVGVGWVSSLLFQAPGTQNLDGLTWESNASITAQREGDMNVSRTNKS